MRNPKTINQSKKFSIVQLKQQFETGVKWGEVSLWGEKQLQFKLQRNEKEKEKWLKMCYTYSLHMCVGSVCAHRGVCVSAQVSEWTRWGVWLHIHCSIPNTQNVAFDSVKLKINSRDMREKVTTEKREQYLKWWEVLHRMHLPACEGRSHML